MQFTCQEKGRVVPLALVIYDASSKQRKMESGFKSDRIFMSQKLQRPADTLESVCTKPAIIS
jgi:hypothetical protein